jgi:hypothetical protein
MGMSIYGYRGVSGTIWPDLGPGPRPGPGTEAAMGSLLELGKDFRSATRWFRWRIYEFQRKGGGNLRGGQGEVI